MRPALAFLLALALAASGCSSSGPEEPEPELGSSTVTVRINGGAPVTFEALAALGYVPAGGQLPERWSLGLMEGMQIGEGRMVLFGMEGPPPGAGAYAVRPSHVEGGLSAFLVDPRDNPPYNASGHSGTLTLTRVTETAVHGRFAFEAEDFVEPVRRYVVEGTFSARRGRVSVGF